MIPVVSPNAMRARRLFFLAANLLTYATMLVVLAHAIGWSGLNLILFATFAIFTPWSVLGFWNAAIGLTLLFSPRRPQTLRPDPPVTLRTAIIMTIRNEDPERAVARLRRVQQSIDATGEGAWFAFFLLSDTTHPDIAAREEVAMAAWRAQAPSPDRLHYRRRVRNPGFKAGNVMDFCQHWGDDFELMLTLDADSLMSGPAVLHLSRIMQANPRFGIVQGLVTGLPSASMFARTFQFGMRHGMRSYTMGQAWWTGDCGPFWGHNAIIRIAPFRDYCVLPKLPGRPPFGGDILSHDQVEAALMRRAGFEVRLQPVAGGSWEDNPPTVLDYIRRDLRWCQGNLQYLKLLFMPGLKPMGRFQLVNAIMMYAGAPAGLLMIVAGLAMIGDSSKSSAPAALGFALYFVMLALGFAPRLLGMLDVLLRADRRRLYGGPLRLLAGSFVDTLFSIFLGPLMMIAQSLFVAGLVFGRRVMWDAQNRDGRVVRLREAVRGLWPQMLFGLAVTAILVRYATGVLPWAAPTILPCLLAVPFTCLTAGRVLGRLFVRLRLCAIPDEYAPPQTVIISNAG
jgi:membrane glycosyltransferase